MCFNAGQLIGFDFRQEIMPHTEGVVSSFCTTLPTSIIKKKRFLDLIELYNSSISPFGSFHRPKWQISQPLYVLQRVKSLPFHISKAWKRYPFQAEPPRIGHHREYPPPLPQTCYVVANQEDQFRFLGNCPPTPPLTQHFALSEK